jgi:hypothetical protein
VASCGGGSQPLAPGGPGSRPPGTTTWLRGARCTDPGHAGDGSAAPGEKPPRWSAERRASRVTGRKAPRKRLAYRVISAFTRVCDAHDTPNGCRCTRTFLGAPPTPRFGVSEARMQNPDAKMRRGNERGCLNREMESANKPTCGCGNRSPAPIHCFRIVIYNENRNSHVSSANSRSRHTRDFGGPNATNKSEHRGTAPHKAA